MAKKSADPPVLVVGSGIAGLSCAEALSRRDVPVTVISPGTPGRDGASGRVHALAPWVLLSAPWQEGSSVDAYVADLMGGQDPVRLEQAKAVGENAVRVARELRDVLQLDTLDSRALRLAGWSGEWGLRCLPRQRDLLLPLVVRCREQGVGLLEHQLAIGVIRRERRVLGLETAETPSGIRRQIYGRAVVLACGGPGAIFPVTTQPRWNVGTGLALADLVGAELRDPGLLQVIPVTDPGCRFPSTAALSRGTISQGGRELKAGGDLETLVRAMEGGAPTRWTPARDEDKLVLDLMGPEKSSEHTLVLASHFGLGGVATDRHGRTSIPGLFACGEAGAGCQGTGRMMGTGLLEARISGQRVADFIQREVDPGGADGIQTEAVVVKGPASPDRLRSWLDKLTPWSAGVSSPDRLREVARTIQTWPRDILGEANAELWLLALRGAGARAFFGGGMGPRPLSLERGSGYDTDSELNEDRRGESAI